jgi:hypothetical protein
LFSQKDKESLPQFNSSGKSRAKPSLNSVDAFLAALATSDAPHLNSVHFKNSHEKEIRFTICLL